MLKERQKDILQAVILEYIETARPVASRDLAEAFHYEVSPATIRNELGILDERGYLAKPHASAGRIPTDLAYRFFVDHLMRPVLLARKERALVAELFSIHEQDDFLRVLGKTLTELSGAYVAAAARQERHIHTAGLAQMLEEPEFEDKMHVRSLIRFIEALDEELYDFAHAMKNSQTKRVFIGRENPFGGGSAYTIMMTEWRHPGGFDGFAALVGPVRMDYQKNLAVTNHIDEVVASFPNFSP